MAFLDQRQQPFVFAIPAPRYIRAIGIVPLTIAVAAIVFVYLKVGAHGFQANIDRSVDLPVFWLALVSLVGLFVFALWILFPPKRSLARFEFSRACVRFIPNSVARTIGEPRKETAISSNSAEILLCYRIWPGRQSSYRIIVRAADGNEQELGGYSPHTQIDLSASKVARLMEGITPATGLPARTVIRQRTGSGAFEETLWAPPVTTSSLFMGVGLAAAGLPFIGGIVMGWIAPSIAIAVAAGIAFWLSQMLVLVFIARRAPSRKKFPILHVLSTTILYSATYCASFVVTAYFVHSKL